VAGHESSGASLALVGLGLALAALTRKRRNRR
jgi:LPXTG-motif cell wall-anchored protein